jgi:hypothetical protein
MGVSLTYKQDFWAGCLHQLASAAAAAAAAQELLR